ncbi:MAG TPA: hypothetical protein DCP92_05960 [Nitrospiraceae bacterium]|jgi:hypothetical protein|nr:hypothetical protein [Nitrospiraceae bacterium]
MVIKNEDIRELVVEVPEGHKHLRAVFLLEDGTEVVFQEATIANLVRAYISLKTHPSKESVKLKRVKLAEKKEGYAEWQLLETEQSYT